MAAWVRQDAIPSYICVNLCYLWETLLYKKLLCVPWVLWEYSSPTDYTDQHRWLVALVAAWVRQDAIPSYICVNLCYLWETLLYKKLLCVPWVLWEYSSPTDYTDQHRWLVALVAAWVRQDAIPSYICVNLCYLWETLLYKKLLCVPWVLWEYSSPTDYTDQHRWLVALVAAWVRQDAIPSNKASVRSVGGNFKNVAAWVRQDAIPSYTMGSEMPCIF